MEYKRISKDHFDDVIRHLYKGFFADEPLNKAAGLCINGERNIEVENYSYETLKDNLSIMAVDEHDKIAGVLLNGVIQSGDVHVSQKKLELCHDESFKKIFQLLYSHNLKIDLFTYFGVDKIFDMRILSVDKSYRGRGIAKELVSHSEKLAKELNFKLAKTDATGIFSQKIMKSNGFVVISELFYNKYVDEYGHPILPVESPHVKLQLLYKVLQ